MNGQRALVNGQRAAGGIELHIEELVLHGFAPGDRQRIGAAVAQELARLLATGPLTRHESVDRVEAGTFRVPRGAKPAAVGAQIAGAIYGGLNR